MNNGHKNLRVLVLEDQLVVAEDLKMQLEDNGHKVCGSVMKTSDAVQICVGQRPDLIIIDEGLKGEPNAIEAALKLREVHLCPIIFLITSRRLPRNHFSRFSHKYVLNKPFSAEEFHNVLQNISRAAI
ncbi:MAG: hypothetical protein C5B54_04860 [Acidobacteria bacterium]|nr:MAG: hypothetical protein C5B54_04860 [Acidobacteriota bacterium]